jgi:hypothetical protein
VHVRAARLVAAAEGRRNACDSAERAVSQLTYDWNVHFQPDLFQKLETIDVCSKIPQGQASHCSNLLYPFHTSSPARIVPLNSCLPQ